MKTTLYIFITILLVSCNEPSEDKLLFLKNNWIKADTALIDEKRLKVRFERALKYVQTHRGYWGYPLDEGCNEIMTDTLREEGSTFKIVPTPLKSTNSDNDISFTLHHLWSCNVYNISFDSLMDRVNKYSSKPSEETKLVINYSSDTMTEITSWREDNFNKLNGITSSIIEKLPSDEESEKLALFEVPTGKTIRVHLPFSYNFSKTDWDSLKYLPNEILYETVSASTAIIFFTDEDLIEKVWWTTWIR